MYSTWYAWASDAKLSEPKHAMHHWSSVHINVSVKRLLFCITEVFIWHYGKGT